MPIPLNDQKMWGFFSLFLCFAIAVSCDQKSSLELFQSSSFHLTKATSGEDNDMNYAVTKEMIVEFLKMEQSEKSIISVKGYPSEDAPSLFLVNYEEGWKLFPADSRFGVIMAESPLGHIDLWEETDNLGFELGMESLHEQIEHSRKISLEHYNEQAVKFWRTLEPKSKHRIQSSLSRINVEQNRGLWVVLEVGRSLGDSTITSRPHLVPSTWGQNYPWNMKMPVVGTDTCKVGCAAVAVAQVLFYFNRWNSSPTGLYHQISEISRYYDYLAQGYSLTLNRGGYVSNSTRWDEMPWSKDSGITTHFGYASDLMLDIGVRLGMRYNTNSSGVSVVDGTNYFSLSPANISFSWAPYNYSTVDTVINNLIARKPVIMTATRGDCSYYRHTWVVDGLWEREMYTLVQYELWPVTMLSEIYHDSYSIVAIMNESEMAATYPGYFAGMSFSQKEDSWDLLQLYMNWGDDGERQWDSYYPYPETSWEGYSVTKAIHYNLVPGELDL